MKDGDESLWGSDSSRETIERPQARHVTSVAEGRSQQALLTGQAWKAIETGCRRERRLFLDCMVDLLSCGCFHRERCLCHRGFRELKAHRGLNVHPSTAAGDANIARDCYPDYKGCAAATRLES